MFLLLLAFASFCGDKQPPKRLVIVTGGARGIGFETAKLFVEEGAQVIITDNREEAGQKAAQELKCEFFAMDVSCEEDWKRLLKKHPQWDVLFNNAGVVAGTEGIVEVVKEETFRHVLGINLWGQILGCKYAIQAMKDRGGVIINNASLVATKTFPSSDVAYAVSKAGVVRLTEQVAADCCVKGYKIRCNCILPGPVQSEMLQGDQKGAQAPTKYLASPHGIALCVFFLASNKSRRITGQKIVIDGGLSLSI